jgi:hypothetical protein
MSAGRGRFQVGKCGFYVTHHRQLVNFCDVITGDIWKGSRQSHRIERFSLQPYGKLLPEGSTGFKRVQEVQYRRKQLV